MNEAPIYIIEDDYAVRRSLGAMLGAMHYRTLGFPSAERFLSDLKGAEPGCILLDLYLAQMTGFDLLRMLRAHGVPMPVIAMTGRGSVPVAVDAMRAGAMHVLEKPVEKAVLLDALGEAHAQLERSRRALQSEIAARARLEILTPREQDVLRRLMHGRTSKGIAGELGISQRTVENHRAHIMDKLGIHSLPQIVQLALNAGLLR